MAAGLPDGKHLTAMQFCSRCWRRIISISFVGATCPIPNCSGTVVHVDDDFGLAVQLLNRKGWRTENSCSGHPDYAYFQHRGACYWARDLDAYVQFDKIYHFPSLPDGFRLETRSYADTSVSCLTADLNTDDPFETQRIVWELAQNLLNWAKNLPSNDADLEANLHPFLQEAIDTVKATQADPNPDEWPWCDLSSRISSIEANRTIDPILAWHLRTKYLGIKQPQP